MSKIFFRKLLQPTLQPNFIKIGDWHFPYKSLNYIPPVRNNTRIQQKTRFPVKLYRKEAIWQRGERIINNWSAVLVLITATASKYQDRVKDHPRRVAPTMPGTDDTTQSGTPCSAGWLANKLLKGHPLQVTSEYYGKNECPVSRCPVGSYISCTYIAYLSRQKKEKKETPRSHLGEL